MLSKRKIWCAVDLLKARFFKKRFPFAVSWHLTYRCNYNCLYCDISNMEEKDELSTAQIYSVIDDLAVLGTRRVHFCGGESLLREDFPGIVDYCKKKSIETGLISNGALIPSYAKELRNLTLLKLSLDGPSVIHDKLRGCGAHERVLEAVEAARREKITTIFNCTLTNLNLPYVESIIADSRKLKIPVKFSPLNYLYAGNKDIKTLIPEPNLYKEKIEYIKAESRRSSYIVNSITALRYISTYPVGPKMKHCIAGRIFCHIKPDGSVYPCERSNKDKVFSCRNEKISDIFCSLPLPNCSECWCTSTLELNLAYSFDIFSLLKLLERYL